jgi:pilus assembly protein CpaF
LNSGIEASNLKTEFSRILHTVQNRPSSGPMFLDTPQTWQTIVDELIPQLKITLGSSELQRLRYEFVEFGPLHRLLDDLSVTEIMINSRSQIWYESELGIVQLEDCFYDDLTFRNAMLRICQESGIIVDLNSPFGDGRWRDFRVHVGISPVVESEWMLTLRRQARTSHDISWLQTQKWASAQALELLKGLISQNKNFLVVGPTSSGKTTVLNCLLREIGENERAVLIEDTAELKLPNSCSVQMLTRFDSRKILNDIDLSSLIRQALRMRPDRIILGEVRGPEAKDLLMAFATGHRGCIGTLHADSAAQALLRLEMLVQLGAPQWSHLSVRNLIRLSLDAIVVVKRNTEGIRVLDGIYTISGLEETGFLLEKR